MKKRLIPCGKGQDAVYKTQKSSLRRLDSHVHVGELFCYPGQWGTSSKGCSSLLQEYTTMPLFSQGRQMNGNPTQPPDCPVVFWYPSGMTVAMGLTSKGQKGKRKRRGGLVTRLGGRGTSNVMCVCGYVEFNSIKQIRNGESKGPF
jgi:hypothetical protein